MNISGSVMESRLDTGVSRITASIRHELTRWSPRVYW